MFEPLIKVSSLDLSKNETEMDKIDKKIEKLYMFFDLL